MKAVIYARYSSDSQREESIDGQIRECKEYATKHGIDIVGTYIDRALSAKTDNRPEFQRMIKDSAKGFFDAVIVWKLDRFSRNRYDSAHYKAILRKHGAKLISAKEHISEGAEGIILESMLEGFAEYYSAELSEKIVRGMTENALKCKYNGGSVPLGYRIDQNQHFEVDPVLAPLVVEMYTLYAQGATMQALVNNLNDRGIRAPMRGGKISMNIIHRMLKNRRYIGEYSYRGMVVENGVPAIVPQALFDDVQARMESNRKAPAKRKAEDEYLLTTKLFCGHCGAVMVGESGRSKTGKVHRYYKCASVKRKKTCNKKSVKKDWIENLVVAEIMKSIMDDEVLDRIIDALMEYQSRENQTIPILASQLETVQKSIANLIMAMEQGIITPSTKDRLQELEAQKLDLENQIICEEIARPQLTREQLTYFIYRFRKTEVSDLQQKQRLIDSFVNAIYLYDDKLVFTFNYKEGAKTVSLLDIQSSDLDFMAPPSPNSHAGQNPAWLFG